jgi:hypothetical protein
LRTAPFTIRAVACIAACLCIAGFVAISPATARDLAAMSGEEIGVLQQRLTDAGCYAGAIDGKASEALAAAKKACPDQEPVLGIETGMHVAQINRIGVDAQCRLAATGSDDKTVRLWSLPDGKLLRALRPPIGAGNGGKVFAAAISPNGRFVAAGGWDAHYDVDAKNAVSIFDAASGALIARVGAFENVILHLAFSRDGRWLAATLFGGAGLRVIDATTWREIAADKDYAGNSYAAAFGPDGRLYTVANDGKMLRYGPGPKFDREAFVETRGGKQPFSIAIDPPGERIAIGFAETTAVDLYDAPSLAFRAAADTHGVDNGDLGEVAWRGDGRALLAGGRYVQGGKDPFLLFDREGRRVGDPPPALAGDTIVNLAPCGDGFAVAAADPAFGLVDGSGRERLWRIGVAADMRGKRFDAFTIAKDAKRIQFGIGYGDEKPVLFDLARATLDDAPKPPPGLTQPLVKGLPIEHWLSETDPTFAGKPIALDPYEMSRSLALRPGRRGFVLGAEWYLRGFDARGAQEWKVAGPEVAFGVNVSADDRLVVAAYGDGTIRWHRVDNGRELLALFVNRDTKTWVAWTSSGYYLASPGGEDLIGWHVNRGWAQAADFFPASRFRDRFNRPDIVQLVLDTLDEDAAVKQANEAARRHVDAAPLTAKLPPVTTILVPGAGAHFSGGEVTIEYSLRSPSGLPIDGVDALVDGRTVKLQALAASPGDDSAKRSVTIPVPPKNVEIGLLAHAGDVIGDLVKVALVYDGPKPADVLKPKLYILAIGVSDYVDDGLKLGFAAKDAKDFAAALQAQGGGLYAEAPVAKVLTDREVTRDAVIDGLEWLEKQATSRDVAIVYLAGHGLTDERQNYWFLPADATPEHLRRTAVSQDDIRRSLQAIAGKAVLFLDTCHANQAVTAGRRGTTDINSVVNDLTSAENGVVTFASSTGREVSFERGEWGNGAFTKAIVEGLGKGDADLLHNGEITLSELDAYVVDRVKTLTGGEQHPVMTRPNTVPDFPIAIVRK